MTLLAYVVALCSEDGVTPERFSVSETRVPMEDKVASRLLNDNF